MKHLHFYTKKVPLDGLTYLKLFNLCNESCRYNCMTDLTLKGDSQIHTFINRANQLYQKKLKIEGGTDSIIKKSQIKIYLDIVFGKEYFEPECSGFPWYEFLSFNILEEVQVKSSGLGVMLSSYLHDFDREQIEKHTLGENDIGLSILFWKSLFDETYFNGGFPPLKGQTPVFIFPCQTEGNTVRSSTNDYMKYLGLEMDVGYTLDNTPLRIFYQSTHPKLVDRNLYFAFLAIGQVCLEMTRPDIYGGNSELLPFNRDKFTPEVKRQQKQRAIEWLTNHGLLDELTLHN